MTKYAAKTEVNSEKSVAEIRRIIRRYGASKFAQYEDDDSAAIGFVMNGLQVRIRLPLPDRNQRDFTHYRHSSGGAWVERTESAKENQYEQAIRQKWRALALVVKAKLEAVESGITAFEQEWYGYIVLPSGKTVFEETGAQVAHMIETGDTSRLQLES